MWKLQSDNNLATFVAKILAKNVARSLSFSKTWKMSLTFIDQK